MVDKSKKAVICRCFQNRCSKKFVYIHKKTPVLESLLNKVAGLRELQHRCFPVNIAKFLRTAYFIENL